MSLTKDEVNEDNLQQEIEALEHRMEIKNIDESLRFPQFVVIEPIRHCNARCPFCAIDKWDKSNPIMSDELFEKIAEELADHKDWIRMVDIQRAGEPLLDKKLPKKVKRIKDAGIRFVTISTNGSLLDEKRGRALLEAGIDEVMISIDSVKKEVYEKLRVGLDFDQVMANIQNFFKLRDEVNPKAVIRVRGVACFDVDDPRGQQELNEWEAFFAPLRGTNDRTYMKKLHNWGNTHEWGDKKEDYDLDWDYAPCIIPWSTIHITSMGLIPLCGQDTDAFITLGDLNTSTIAEIWRGEKFQEVRNKHRAGLRNDISFCQGCKVFDASFSIERTPNRKKGFFHIKPNA